ncbi:MAG: hypothetical protein WA397_16785, partial [Roseiarcus sp.]
HPAKASVASGSTDRRKAATECTVIKAPHNNLAIREIFPFPLRCFGYLSGWVQALEPSRLNDQR